MKSIAILALAVLLCGCASKPPYNSGNIVLSPAPAVLKLP